MDARADWNVKSPVAGPAPDEAPFDGGKPFTIIDYHKGTKENGDYDWERSYLFVEQEGRRYGMTPLDFAAARGPHITRAQIGEELGISKQAVIGKMLRAGLGQTKHERVLERNSQPSRSPREKREPQTPRLPQAGADESRPARTKPAVKVSFKGVSYSTLSRLGMEKRILDTGEVISLYEGIELNRKKLLHALCGHPLALQKIAEWYTTGEKRTETEALGFFAEKIWAKVKTVSELQEELKQADTAEAEEAGEDADATPKEKEASNQPDFGTRWRMIGEDCLRLQGVVAKNIDPVANATAFRRYEESRNDLVDSILQLRPYDRLLKELVAQAKEASPNLQTQRAFYLAHNALHNMATSQETMRKHNQRLVAKLAHPRSNRGNASYGLDFEELMAEGNIGLMKAIELFDHRRGVSFATHAHWWIRASIEYARRDRTCTIRLPSHIVGALSKLRNAENSLRAAFNREPTPEELAEKMDQPVAFVVRVQEAARLAYTSSLDAPLKEGEDGGSWHDQTEDTQVPDSIHLLFQGQSRTILTRAMLTLKPREERLLRMRFGVHPNNDHTLEEVGAKFSLTHERVRQLEAKALRKLKHKATPLKLRQLVA